MVNAEGRKRKELEVMEKGKKKKGRMLMMYSHEAFVDFRYEMVIGYHGKWNMGRHPLTL